MNIKDIRGHYKVKISNDMYEKIVFLNSKLK